MSKVKKFKARAPCHVTNHILGVPDPDFPIHYTTFCGATIMYDDD